MRCPILAELPPPPPGKTGWPWTEESPQLPDTMHDGSPWPRISIVTPNYNYGQFLEETIRSVLLQGYPNLEYLIIDGGSTDNSVEIIKKYEPWLTYWVSEPDRGQSHAINKGIGHLTGEIFAYINSDDFYLPGAFAIAAEVLQSTSLIWLCGNCLVVNEDSRSQGESRSHISSEAADWILHRVRDNGTKIIQPTCFIKFQLFSSVGIFDESLRFSFDFEFFTRLFLKGYMPKHSDFPVAAFRIHEKSKTVSNQHTFIDEDFIIAKRYKSKLSAEEIATDFKKMSLLTYRVWISAYTAHTFGSIQQRFRVTLKALWYHPHLLAWPRLYLMLWRSMLLKLRLASRFWALRE